MNAAIASLREFNYASVLVRLLLALATGAAIGYGRSNKRANAGLRTYMLTCLGAAMTMLISMYEYEMLSGPWAEAAAYVELKFDTSRFSQQVINGIGFLAAGTIIGVAHMQVSGLTTAIGLFAAACLGIAAGAGFYECVLLSVGLIVFTLEFMQPLEHAYKRRARGMTIHVEYGQVEDIQRITEAITGLGAAIFDMDLEQQESPDSPQSAVFSIKMARGRASHAAMLSTIAELNCVSAVQELIS